MPSSEGSLSRRRFLESAACCGVVTLLPGTLLLRGATPVKPHRIDVHHHLSPPNYVTAVRAKNQLQGPTAGWTVAKAIEDMDQAGIKTAITSISTPGVWFGNAEEGRRVARDSNDYAARLMADHPGRFGMFAAIPLPDTEGSLREIEYALDTLKADGIGLLTSYGDKWLGDPAFDAVFEELNRRKAVVYTHPTAANCCRSLVPDLTDATIEFGTDTTRAIGRVVFSGTAARYPNIRWIFSHAGGTMPFLAERFINLAKQPQFASKIPQGFMAEAVKFYYDTAQAANAPAMAALRKVIPLSHIVFGTDYPFRTMLDNVTGLAGCGAFTAKELLAIDRDNALPLLPRYRS